MTYYDVYVAYDDDSFSWDNGNWNGNCPRNGSPRLPVPAPFNELIDKIQDGTYEGKQLDWGSWGAKVTKRQIVDFIKGYYDDAWLRRNSDSPHTLNELVKVYDFVQELDIAGTYVLVALET